MERPWDNSGLRQRVEGKPIEGIDILALQSNVVAREPERARRREPAVPLTRRPDRRSAEVERSDHVA